MRYWNGAVDQGCQSDSFSSPVKPSQAVVASPSSIDCRSRYWYGIIPLCE